MASRKKRDEKDDSSRHFWKYERLSERTFKPYSKHRNDKLCTWIPNRDTRFRPPYRMLLLMKRVYMAHVASPFSRPACFSVQACLGDALLKAGDLDHFPLEKISIFETVDKRYVMWRCEACNVTRNMESHYVNRDCDTYSIDIDSLQRAYRDPRSQLYQHWNGSMHNQNLIAYKKFEHGFIDCFNALNVNGFFQYYLKTCV